MTADETRDAQGAPERAVREQGFTMLEAIIVFTIATLLSAMIAQSLTTLSTSQRWSERQAEALAKAELVMAAITDDLESAIRVFPENGNSRSLLSRLDLGELTPMATAVLPLTTSRGHFEPDAPGRLETGNMILIGRTDPPIVVSKGLNLGTARIDVYRFVLYCLHDHGGRIDIDRWESARVARADDVARILETEERASVVRELNQAGIEVAWRPEEADFDFSLFSLSRGGSAPRLPIEMKIRAATVPPRREMLQKSRLEVARNGAGGAIHMPLYAHRLPDYPHGLELKIDGDGAGRLVLVRLVVASTISPQETPVGAAVERVVSIREP